MCIPFDPKKASTLASKLEIETEVAVESYKEVFVQWMEEKGSEKCTYGQLVCALFESGLAKLASRLRPICEYHQEYNIEREGLLCYLEYYSA